MKKSVIIFSVIFTSILFAMSCQRIYTPTDQKGELDTLELSSLKGIPSEYGKLINVTPRLDFPGFVQLWFVDEQQTIRVVAVSQHEARIYEKVMIIPRY